MIKTPSSKYLTYKYPIWQGCTLQEIIVLCAAVLAGVIVGFVMLPGLIGIPSWVGVIIGGISLKPLVKYCVRRTGEWKKNKPYGYLMTAWLLRIAGWGFIQLPYVRRVGVWRTTKRILKR